MCPSPFRSLAWTDWAPLASVVMTWAVKFSFPSFSYQAILSSSSEADSTSMCPSPFRSLVYAEVRPLASHAAVMTWVIKLPLPSFLYQAILLYQEGELSYAFAEITSMLPSPSKSAACKSRDET